VHSSEPARELVKTSPDDTFLFKVQCVQLDEDHVHYTTQIVRDAISQTLASLDLAKSHFQVAPARQEQECFMKVTMTLDAQQLQDGPAHSKVVEELKETVSEEITVVETEVNTLSFVMTIDGLDNFGAAEEAVAKESIAQELGVEVENVKLTVLIGRRRRLQQAGPTVTLAVSVTASSAEAEQRLERKVDSSGFTAEFSETFKTKAESANLSIPDTFTVQRIGPATEDSTNATERTLFMAMTLIAAVMGISVLVLLVQRRMGARKRKAEAHLAEAAPLLCDNNTAKPADTAWEDKRDQEAHQADQLEATENSPLLDNSSADPEVTLDSVFADNEQPFEQSNPMATVEHEQTDKVLEEIETVTDTPAAPSDGKHWDYLRMTILDDSLQDDEAEAEVREAFAVLDKDGDGSFAADELRHFMGKLGEELDDTDLSAMVHDADTDGDGRISFEEFKAVMMKLSDGVQSLTEESNSEVQQESTEAGAAGAGSKSGGDEVVEVVVAEEGTNEADDAAKRRAEAQKRRAKVKRAAAKIRVKKALEEKKKLAAVGTKGTLTKRDKHWVDLKDTIAPGQSTADAAWKQAIAAAAKKKKTPAKRPGTK
jgi:hypothetical protein